MPQEMSIAHGASKRRRARPFRSQAASFIVIAVPVVWVSCALLGLCVAPGGAVGIPEVSIKRLVNLSCHRLESSLARKLFLPPEPLGWPFVPRPQDGRGENRGLDPML
jgi:hypothetical protein